MRGTGSRIKSGMTLVESGMTLVESGMTLLEPGMTLLEPAMTTGYQQVLFPSERHPN
jgi:hypothetical protein